MVKKHEAAPRVSEVKPKMVVNTRKTETMKIKRGDKNPFAPRVRSEIAQLTSRDQAKFLKIPKSLKAPKFKVKARKPIATRKK